MRLLTCCALLLSGCLVSSSAHAQKKPAPQKTALQNENLLVGLPKGYKLAYQTRVKNMKLTEMIPKSQSLKSWSEMLTVQVFLRDKKLTPVKFFQLIGSVHKKSCRDSRATLIKKGFEDGYAFSFFFLVCPLNPKTGKPEYTWFKTIRGHDSFYVVQKAWKKSPGKASIIKWSKYLRSVSVCDTRLAKQKCPGS